MATAAILSHLRIILGTSIRHRPAVSSCPNRIRAPCRVLDENLFNLDSRANFRAGNLKLENWKQMDNLKTWETRKK